MRVGRSGSDAQKATAHARNAHSRPPARRHCARPEKGARAGVCARAEVCSGKGLGGRSLHSVEAGVLHRLQLCWSKDISRQGALANLDLNPIVATAGQIHSAKIRENRWLGREYQMTWNSHKKYF